MELKEVLKRRHSTRSFRASKARLKDVFDILESALHAPTAGNVSTLRIILVEDAKLKGDISNAAVDNDFLNEASHLIVVCSDLRQAQAMYEDKGPIYAAQQAGAAIENMLLTIEDLGLATCWTGSFDENAVKRMLSIPDDVRVEAILPIGYEMKAREKKKKTEFKEVVYYNKFGKNTQ